MQKIKIFAHFLHIFTTYHVQLNFVTAQEYIDRDFIFPPPFRDHNECDHSFL